MLRSFHSVAGHQLTFNEADAIQDSLQLLQTSNAVSIYCERSRLRVCIESLIAISGTSVQLIGSVSTASLCCKKQPGNVAELPKWNCWGDRSIVYHIRQNDLIIIALDERICESGEIKWAGIRPSTKIIYITLDYPYPTSFVSAASFDFSVKPTLRSFDFTQLEPQTPTINITKLERNPRLIKIMIQAITPFACPEDPSILLLLESDDCVKRHQKKYENMMSVWQFLEKPTECAEVWIHGCWNERIGELVATKTGGRVVAIAACGRNCLSDQDEAYTLVSLFKNFYL